MLHPSKPRHWLAILTAAVLGAAATLVGASPAFADGEGYIYRAPGGSYGYYKFNDNFDRLRIMSEPQTLASGKCYDIWFDWTRNQVTGNTHFDARVARSCRSWTPRDSGTNTESKDNKGYNKLGVCYGNNNATTSPISNCTSTSLSGVVPSIPNWCTRAWWVTSGGTVNYDGGGAPTSCTS